MRITIFHLATPLSVFTQSSVVTPGRPRLQVTWSAPGRAPRGYGAQAELVDPPGQGPAAIATAFDVLPDWTVFPRYGFLSDFSPGRGDISETIESLARYHLNGLQFYDWQYRHDCLVPPQPEYLDPLGRRLSLRTVERFITAAHAHGLAAMPYLAVYAASAEYWRAHPEAALYNSEGQPIPFGENFLGLMGVAKRSVFVIDKSGIVRYRWVTDDALVLPDFDAAIAVLQQL